MWVYKHIVRSVELGFLKSFTPSSLYTLRLTRLDLFHYG